MKRIILAGLLAMLVFAGPAQAGTGDVTATLTLLNQSATSVTVYAEQTGGEQTPLYVQHDCYDDLDDGSSLYIPAAKASFLGAGTFTFATSGRYRGQDWVGDFCGAYVYLPVGGRSFISLAQVTTVP